MFKWLFGKKSSPYVVLTKRLDVDEKSVPVTLKMILGPMNLTAMEHAAFDEMQNNLIAMGWTVGETE